MDNGRVTLADLRSAAVARSLFAPTTLPRALDTVGFVQADPIRARRARKTSRCVIV
jgi:hypothetical protein